MLESLRQFLPSLEFEKFVSHDTNIESWMQSRFTRSKESNGVSYDDIQSVFATFGDVVGIHAADETGARVIVCFSEVSSAQRAFRALNGYSCQELGGRTLHIRYSVLHPAAKAFS